MKALRCPNACALRLLAVFSASVLLVQCSMPPQQAWRYIQTNGLLPYLSYSTQHQSPPFRTRASNSPRYAGSSSYRGRSTLAPNWFSNWSSGMPNRVRYRSPYSSSASSNRYFSAPVASSPNKPSRSAPRPKSTPSPSVKIPVEEPSPAPQVASQTPPTSPSSAPSSAAPSPKPAASDLPYGSAIPGRMNMVNSPYAGKTQLVDVSGMSPGQTVKCPYTGKLFKVPPTQQASNNTEQRQESKVETPKLNSEPKSEN